MDVGFPLSMAEFRLPVYRSGKLIYTHVIRASGVTRYYLESGRACPDQIEHIPATEGFDADLIAKSPKDLQHDLWHGHSAKLDLKHDSKQ